MNFNRALKEGIRAQISALKAERSCIFSQIQTLKAFRRGSSRECRESLTIQIDSLYGQLDYVKFQIEAAYNSLSWL